MSGNSGGKGGLWTNVGVNYVHASTISNNTTSQKGGGIYAIGGKVDVTNSTITENSANDGGGIYTFYSELNVTGSIVANNSATSNNNIGGTPMNTDAFNIIGGDPMLGPLADNGGPTLTHALLPGSPAINAGDPSFAGFDVAMRGQASQSSLFLDDLFPAANAIDGDPNTFSNTDVNEANPSWQVDFVTDQEINQVILHNRTDTCCRQRLRDITVQVLDGDGNAVFTSALLNPDNVLNGPLSIPVDGVELSGEPSRYLARPIPMGPFRLTEMRLH